MKLSFVISATSLLVQVALSIEVEVSDMGTILGHPRNSFDPAGRVVKLFLDNTHLQYSGSLFFFIINPALGLSLLIITFVHSFALSSCVDLTSTLT